MQSVMQLSEYLIKHNVSRADFADKIGVTQASVSRYAAGERVPRPEHIIKIKEATRGKVKADDFMEIWRLKRGSK